MNKFVKRVTSVFLTVALMATSVFSAVPVTAENTCDKTATEITADMTVGWNLGNTLDATGEGLLAETSWGNPKTTKAMIDAVKDAGFNTVRVPVSWGTHTSGSDYTIDSAWMARVKEVVDYCIDNDMYVILNTHHDIGTSTNGTYYYPSHEYLDSSNDYLESVWTQIANEFKDYDYHLVFETLNEPRLAGTDYEWYWQNDSLISDAFVCINDMNQTAVDAIRATGGNNSTRCIMVPGYCASIAGATSSYFQLPTDSASDRLIVSVHAYTPYNFALNGSGTSTFSDDLKSEIDSLFTSIDQIGVPVIIGEMSASNKSNSAERVKWAEYYFGKSKEYGVPCMLWDNNEYYYTTITGEEHGHLNRETLTWYDEAFIEAIMDTMGVEYDLTGGTSAEIDLTGATTIWTGSSSASNWGVAVQFNATEFKVSEMSEDTIIAVKYTGDTPRIAVEGNNTSFTWILPTSTADGVAYFNYSEILSAFATNGISDLSKVFVYGVTSNTTTVTEVLYFSNSIEADTPYMQKTNVRNGVYSARAVMLVSEADAENASKVVFTFNNGSKSVEIESTKCYSKITAAGDTLEAPDGYVYVAYAIKNIPEGVTLKCTKIELA